MKIFKIIILCEKDRINLELLRCNSQKITKVIKKVTSSARVSRYMRHKRKLLNA